MYDTFNSLVIDTLLSFEFQEDDLDSIIQFIFSDEERLQELIIRLDVESWWISRKMGDYIYP